MTSANCKGLADRLWTNGGQRTDPEKLIRSILGKFEIPVARVEQTSGEVDCIVPGPLSPLQELSIAVLRETLRTRLPFWVEFRITVLG